MIGRFACSGCSADADRPNALYVVLSGSLILAAVVAEYVLGLPEMVTISLAGASLCFTGVPIIWKAVQGLLHFQTNVDELIALAILASVVLGEWISAAIVAWIMVLGGLIEQFTSQRARRHIEALLASSPAQALLVGDDGQVTTVAVESLGPGDQILVRPGDVVAADGTIDDGESFLDESMLTGESVPVAKQPGDAVSAGTINGPGSLKIRVQRVGQQSTQGKIVQLIQEAEQHRAPILRVAEAYAQWFTPTILTLAGIVWLVTGEPLRAVTVLIVGCPCAFVLATPTAVIAALGRASKHGVLIKGGKYLEACAKVDVLALDKTGTLTNGRCRIRDVTPLDGMTSDQLLYHAARLEAGAEHPLARAVVELARSRGIEVPPAASIRREAGLGVAELADSAWRIGNQRLMERHQIAIPAEAAAMAEKFRREGRTVLFVAEGSALRGLLTVEDEIRDEAGEVLARLRADGYDDIYVLTGDAQTVARQVASQLDVPAERTLAELTPEHKYRHLESLQEDGHRVCYVGDGTNDGPALALASVGVSIGSRENTVALESAHVVLMRDGLAALPFVLRLGKRTARTILQNILLFGLVFNAAMLALSAAGLLTPILGAIGHNLGSVAVVLNSARLLRFRNAPAIPGPAALPAAGCADGCCEPRPKCTRC